MRLLVGLVVPLGAFALALFVFDPQLSAAATILIVVFGALSIGRAANGWMSSSPFAARHVDHARPSSACSPGAFAYVAGITFFEHFVADVVPYDVPAAVGPGVGRRVARGRCDRRRRHRARPGPSGDDLRRRVYVWLFSTGASEPLDPAVASDAPCDRPSTAAATAIRHPPRVVTLGEHA